MKRYLFLILFGFILTSCEGPYIFNRVVKLKDGDKMLYGGVDRQAFLKAPFADWFEAEYNAYQPNPAILKSLKKNMNNCRVVAYVGTWDSHSKMYYPQLIKILDEIKFPEQRRLTFALNEKLKSFYGEEAGKNVEYAPTIIIYKGGEELGRIVESPTTHLLEEDLLMIASKAGYIPNYFED